MQQLVPVWYDALTEPLEQKLHSWTDKQQQLTLQFTDLHLKPHFYNYNRKMKSPWMFCHLKVTLDVMYVIL